MAWDGYFQLDGTEVINVARTEAYARNLGAHWLLPRFKNEALPYMLGDGAKYLTPLLDDAPWVDEDSPESLDFFGFYPLGVDGIESSTRQGTTFESIADGGAVRGLRHGTKTIVFSGLLLAVSEAGAEWGMRWLKQVLNGAPCGGGTYGLDCNGADLCYFSSEPWMEIPTLDDGTYLVDGEVVRGRREFFDPTPCLEPYWRTLRNVTVTNGPLLDAKRATSDGGAVWSVQFTASVGNPYEFGRDLAIIRDFMEPGVSNPWVIEDFGGTYDLDGHVVAEPDCTPKVYTPLVDPLCPALIPPPGPTSVPLGCFNPPANWVRRQITVPKEYIPLWGEVVPVLSVHARRGEVRDLRLRFYTDVSETGDPNVDPCSFCGDVLISYIPNDHTLVFDAAAKQVYVERRGQERRRADSVVYKTDGTPFDWPALTCGFGYIVTFDLPQTQTPPSVDLALTARVI